MAAPSGSTSRLKLPYPIPNDSVDVPRDIQALANALDAQVGWQFTGTFAARPAANTMPDGARYFATDTGTTYQAASGVWNLIDAFPITSAAKPANPVDGQLWDYDASGYVQAAGHIAYSNAGVRWLMRYNAATSFWDYVGGDYLGAGIDAIQNFAANGWADLATVGPRILVPFAGDYYAEARCTFYPVSAGVPKGIGITAGATVPIEVTQYQHVGSGAIAGVAVTMAMQARVTGVTAGNDVRLRQTNGNNGADGVGYRRVFARPTRLQG
jgi:hypothetical protein